MYLRFLSEKQVTVHVKLKDGEVVSGWIEYFDDRMIRLTREGKPNLFIYKEQIHTISESPRKEEGRQRAASRKAGTLGADAHQVGSAGTPAGQQLPEGEQNK